MHRWSKNIYFVVMGNVDRKAGALRNDTIVRCDLKGSWIGGPLPHRMPSGFFFLGSWHPPGVLWAGDSGTFDPPPREGRVWGG